MPNKAWKFEELRDEYAKLWSTMEIRKPYLGVVDAGATAIIKGAARYQEIEAALGVPWLLVGIFHQMECGLSWTKHLHNGDSLQKRTWQVPANRPAKGTPPFTWEESALDALTLKGLQDIKEWPVERILYEMERYNGFGYRNYHPETLSPYLWSFTNHYSSGKYVADGKWSASAVSKQTGAAALLRRLADRDGNFKI